MKITKGDVIAWSMIVIFFSLVLLGAIKLFDSMEDRDNIKKELCNEHGFNWIEKLDGQIVRDCYNIDDGIITFYNLYEFNKTYYLMDGLR